MSKPLIAVLLSGCGVYDGSEIHESVLTLLNIDKEGGEYQCIAPNIQQHHVVNHVSGEEQKETRNVLVESARIARGNVKDIKEVSAADFSALAIPGGFGAAKNLTKWAFSGPDGEIHAEVKRLIIEFVKAGKPIVALCMGPTVIAKALEGTEFHAELTVGNTSEKSPYDIAAISAGMEKTGAVATMTNVHDFTVDESLNIISSPCYMMEATIYEINFGISKAIKRLIRMI
jgi:enhancing lycopene biosynthesis protein 2